MTDSTEDEIQWTLLIISVSLLIAIHAVLAYTTGRIIANRHALHIANVSVWSSALIDYERTTHGCCSHISHCHPPPHAAVELLPVRSMASPVTYQPERSTNLCLACAPAEPLYGADGCRFGERGHLCRPHSLGSHGPKGEASIQAFCHLLQDRRLS